MVAVLVIGDQRMSVFLQELFDNYDVLDLVRININSYYHLVPSAY